MPVDVDLCPLQTVSSIIINVIGVIHSRQTDLLKTGDVIVNHVVAMTS